MTVTTSLSEKSVSLRTSDALIIQQNTFDVMTKCSEIERLVQIGSPSVKDLIDVVVRKTVETQRMVDRYASFHGGSDADAKQKRLLDNFARAHLKVQECMKRYSDSQVSSVQRDKSTTSLKVMGGDNTSIKRPSLPSTSSSSYDYVSSLEEGRVSSSVQTLHDLNRVSKEMSNLQDIYYSLSETAVAQQGSLLDSIQEKVHRATATVSQTVTELGRAKDRIDYWTRVKLYAVSGAAAVGIFFWLI